MKTRLAGTKHIEEKFKLNRKFPTSKMVLLIVTFVIQVGILLAAFLFSPKPQDIIQQYDVTVYPLDDGTLDIQYHLVWEAVDTTEELTWIEVGTANQFYSVYEESVSDNISECVKTYSGNESHLQLRLGRAYVGGEVLELSFKINQKNMLCQDVEGYFYEFVPGWFNATPVENYMFRWADDGRILSAAGAQRKDGYYIWDGSLECGE